jgi:tetratricopeptide (TPR) repeat protein
MITTGNPAAAELYRQGLACYRTGAREDSWRLCEQVLRLEPDHFAAQHLLGLMALDRNEPRLALELLQRSIALRPGSAIAHNHTGNALLELRQFDAALAHYDLAIALDPGYSGAHYNRGNALLDSGRFAEAAESYECAIALEPSHAQAYENRGLALWRLGRCAEAIASYDRAIEIDPSAANAHTQRGHALRELEQFEPALASYDRAIALRPEHAEAHNGRGSALCALRRFDVALESFRQAIALRSDLAEAWMNRANACCELRRWEEAFASYERALRIRPDLIEAHVNCGTAHAEHGDWDAALACFDRAIALRPGHAEAHVNRGNVLRLQNRIPEAIGSFDAALALDPDLARARVNRGMARLLAGDFEAGWQDYEWRWRDKDGWLLTARRELAQPKWLGQESLGGRTILLQCEQGLGDTIQFCRYAERVAALGARVILEVPAALRRLLEGLPGVTQLVVEGEPLPAFDLYCPLLSLPLAFKTTLASIPSSVPYLQADPERSRYWQRRLGERRKARVGLVWCGAFRPEQPELWSVNERRNVPLEKLALLAHPGVEFYSLQKGLTTESERPPLASLGSQGLQINDFTAELADFADTAALITQLDLVISVDTSTAHVAGALGKPLWLLNRFDTCWRWLLDRQDSPWYPTLRLYRQQRPGDWEDVLTRVRADLQQLVERPAERGAPGGWN